MTLDVVTTLVLRCDGLVAAACNVVHPDRPHTCPASLTLDDPWDAETLAAARWAGPAADGKHYCPAHNHQSVS